MAVDTGVAVVRLPGDEDRLEGLRAAGVPRLVLVDGEHLAGIVDGAGSVWLEDWARPDAPRTEVELRCRALRARALIAGPGGPEGPDDGGSTPATGVSLEGGLVVTPRGRVVVPPVEERLLALLLERAGTVVSRRELVGAGWPGRHVSRNSLDVHVSRLRRRLTGVGLTITTVRSRGYLLEVAPAGVRTAVVGPRTSDSVQRDVSER